MVAVQASFPCASSIYRNRKTVSIGKSLIYRVFQHEMVKGAIESGFQTASFDKIMSIKALGSSSSE
jgi:hypothetical protein